VPGLRQGKLALALPSDRPLQQIAVQNIGAFVASIVERRESVFGHRYDIAGDELSGEVSAAILSEVTGRHIQYESVPPDALRAQSEDMALMFEWLNDTGYSADIAGLHRDFPEVTWLDFATWISQQNWSVLDNPEPTEVAWEGRDDK
jgi:uncharacterized protein YbjT (DUF2867 family)